ncbi:cation-translocating P-type ATPase [Thermanaerothrix sp. 4228-RoL]|uniref:Cation-translocating P-type ATPase n=1 Tax=Thermanaerothrix solaris TaxID=3058434 RepID=A0ABU3NT72_9CHLR|nr:cation-translocating P-type ATPase [Thermanaerothrix sp. 4228-RoL]MDT8899327.1 cation-translocating P-type ATPase [Thermanaerothrix sp. 4228-RoL]
MSSEEKAWYQLSPNEVAEYLNSDVHQGLSHEEAQRRLAEVGPNELVERGMKSPWRILWEQLTGIMVVILIISAVISVFLHEYTDALVILVIVVLNALLGFTQEYQAEKAMAALKKMAVPKVKVRRSGHLVEISARELVPGDVIQLEAGDAVPADARLIEAVNLRVQEAVLTGESEPVEKRVEPINVEHLPVADQRNMVFMGTVVTYGRGKALVVRTGMRTELGKIADMIQSVGQESTPLQKRLEQLGRGLALAALGIVAIVFTLGVLRGESVRVMFQTAISMAVAAVPEGLPAVVTIALALGAQRMLKRNALIRKLPAVETLGSVTVICSDKTGTLTENRMTVTVIDVAGHRVDFQEEVNYYQPESDLHPHPLLTGQPSVALMLLGGALCNDATLEPAEEGGRHGFAAVGDPTEGALVIAAAQANLLKQDLESLFPRVQEWPFDSERKRMSTLHRVEHVKEWPVALSSLRDHLSRTWERPVQFLMFTKGAVDSLLEVCDRVWVNNQIQPLDETWRERIVRANNTMAQSGMRVLGVAFRPFWDGDESDSSSKAEESGLIFVGMFGLIDPARPEVFQAVQVAKTAGIRPVMITGDHPLTALYIARTLRIAEDGRVMTGRELAQLSVAELEQQVEDIPVFARVSPEHKLKIVEALQNRGHIVAMTGDGVNDAPALKKADIGVAMGITGTDVSKEAADMVLLDDNFATIVAAVEEGRRIYDNIRKFIKYTLTSNMGEIMAMLLGPFVGLSLPLTPLQILWINLVTDGLPGLALTVEPAERDVMRRKPFSPKENIFGRGLAISVLLIGIEMGVISLLAGLWALYTGRTETWQTMIFTTLTLAQMGNVLAIRSDREPLIRLGIFSNPLLLAAVLLTFVLQMAVVYVPFLQNIFRTRPLPLVDLLVSLVLSSVVFLSIEAVKWVRLWRSQNR